MEALVSAARNGDRRALEDLLRANHSRIYTLCRRMCHNREQAEDATQNALVAIVRGLANFDGRSSFATWSYRIATNAALDEIRRHNRHRVVSLDSSDSFDPPYSLESAGSDRSAGAYREGSAAEPAAARGSTQDPETSVVDAETREALAAALGALDERFRVPLVLRDVAEFDYAEIAELLGIPAGTVRSRISRARTQLANTLSGTALDPRSVSGTSLDPGTGSTRRSSERTRHE